MEDGLRHSLPRFVFVYGTLKKGFWNHTILAKTKLVGVFETAQNKFGLLDSGFPVLIDKKTNGAVIRGEVYEVTEPSVLLRLDRLESEGSMYFRRPITLKDFKEPCEAYYGNLDRFSRCASFAPVEIDKAGVPLVEYQNG